MINGNGSTGGGTFHNVSVNGRGTVHGKVECQTFDCNGMGVFKDNISADSVIVNGYAVLKNNLNAREVSINGKVRIKGDVVTKDIEVSGVTRVNGSLKGEEIKMHGKLTIGSDCEAESFESEGKVMINGLLNAESIFMKMFSFGKMRAKEIGGKSIIIRLQEPVFFKFLKRIFPTFFEVESIEGDHIELQNTHADVVRGNQVHIGEGCKIGLVEYTESFTCGDNAVVKRHRKV